jgi:hypothetical protein
VICPECEGRKWVKPGLGGEVPRLCERCGASGEVFYPGPERDPFEQEVEDSHTWVEAAAFFAVCASLAESSGNPALSEMFRALWERAGVRGNELDEAQLDERRAEKGYEDGELVVPPSHVWGRR